MSLTWTDKQITPANRPTGERDRQLDLRSVIAELSTSPGRWAEVARYPVGRISAARSRGSQTARRHPELEYAVRLADDAAVLYFRVPLDTDTA